ncbi:hypothetical protein [Nocardiopsis alba]|uniref:hypothetical protein n=1 Tax=Nocardiopsis alba TaxID=53437 RepID=UPI0033A27F47
MRGGRRHEGPKSTEAEDRETSFPRTPAEVIETVVEGTRRTPPRPSEEIDPALAWEGHQPTEDEQDRRGHIRGFQRQGGSLAPSNGHRGRAASWVGVALAFVGFALGGLGIVLGGSVVLLVIGAVLMVIALVVAVSCDILSDVVLDPPRDEPEEPHQTPLHRIKRSADAYRA